VLHSAAADELEWLYAELKNVGFGMPA
jgi:hypothetical protein